MRIRSVQLKRFKRFTNVTIEGIPPTARLVIIAGPNGCGKSSFFDGLHSWVKKYRRNHNWDETYHVKSPELGEVNQIDAVTVRFHESLSDQDIIRLRKTIYIRTAYRNDPEFNLGSINKMASSTEEVRFQRMIDNDQTVGSNYQRLVAQALEDVFERESGTTTIADYRDKVLGEIASATQRLFPDLKMNSLGNPLTSGSFKFDKGSSKGFLYKNLSGGEKAAFDLMLDMLVKRREFNDTVFCIDEPEAHMNTRLQGRLLQELFGFTTPDMQLWLATHSVGMMRCARDLSNRFPGEVVFLDFGGRDFDETQIIRPEKPDRLFWERVFDVALDDMAALIAPSEIVLCEGSPKGSGGRHEAIDAACFERIFTESRPDTRFISVGNASSVEEDRLNLFRSLQSLLAGASVRRLVDRDDLSPEEVIERKEKGISVLGRRNLESYLFDEEVLSELCIQCGKPDMIPDVLSIRADAMASAIQRGKPSDDLKAASGDITSRIKLKLGLNQSGNTPKTFMRDTLAPLVARTTLISEIDKSIFFD